MLSFFIVIEVPITVDYYPITMVHYLNTILHHQGPIFYSLWYTVLSNWHSIWPYTILHLSQSCLSCHQDFLHHHNVLHSFTNAPLSYPLSQWSALISQYSTILLKWFTAFSLLSTHLWFWFILTWLCFFFLIGPLCYSIP